MKKLSHLVPSRAVSVLIVLSMVLVPFTFVPNADAAQITTRSLELQTSDDGLTGGSTPGGTVNNEFTFTIPTSTAIGSILFEYCTTPADVGTATCTAPAGLNTATATLGSSSGVTGLTMVHDSANVYHLTRSPGTTVTPGANTIVTIVTKGVTNPTAANETFYVRISTFLDLAPSALPTGSAIDLGSVAASTATPIQLSGVMPESLVFCTGATVGLDVATSTVPDCSTATPGTINFDQLFSSTDTAMATSQMAASTNAGFGYAITVNGPTLTSGSNTITAMSTAGAGVRGTSQFGMNIALNTTTTAPGFGLAPYNTLTNVVSPQPNAANLRGQAAVASGYDTPNTFRYNNGDVVADSANGGAGASDAQIYTVSYIANVPGSQPAGTYSTTLTYVCTPTY